MINALNTRPQEPASAPIKRHPKGWTPARRARQAALIRRWQPWRRSTGPRSTEGKARASQNALRHGGHSRANIMRLRRVRYALRLAAQNLAIVRTYVRITRLERSLALGPRTPQAASKLQLLRDVLARITSAPLPPRDGDLSAEAQRAKAEARRAKPALSRRSA